MSEIEKNNEDWLDITINPNQTKENLIKGDGNLENISDFFSTSVISSSSLDEEKQENTVEYNKTQENITDYDNEKQENITDYDNEKQDIKLTKSLEIDKEKTPVPVIDSMFNCRKKCFPCKLM